MFLISWIVAHWKVLFAAAVAILYFSYRVQRVAPEPEKDTEAPMHHDETKHEAEAQPHQPGQASSAEAHAPSQAAPAGGAPHPTTTSNDNTKGSSSDTQKPSEAEALAQEEAMDTTLDEITGLFANRNPKHALHGFSDALRNVATGVGLGVAGMAAGTYGGAKEGGWTGMAKGFGAGAAGLVGLTGYGLYSGARQAVRGVTNTPSAVSEVNKGEAYWDSNTQKWVRVNLAQDFDVLPLTDDDVMAEARKAYAKAESEGTLPTMAPPPPQPSAEHPEGTEGGAKTAADAPHEGTTAGTPEGEAPAPAAAEEAATEPADYYAFLEVEKTATTAEIRKAYTRKALVMHPDKNPNDPNATLKFQNLNKIYSVLSNEESRAAYDRYGSVDPQNVPEMASNPMKDMLGAAFIEPLVGQLHFFLVFEGGVLLTGEMQKELHHRRRLRVAKNLVSWLDNGATGLEAAQLALRDAVSTALGPVLVSYVAEQYHLSSRQQLYSSAWAREMDSWYSSWAMSASSMWHWTSTGASTARKAFIDKSLAEEDILRVLAVANESDVKHIVLQACRLVLYDTSVTVEQRRERAVGLERLSQMAMAEVASEVATRKSAAAIAASEAQEATAAEATPEANTVPKTDKASPAS